MQLLLKAALGKIFKYNYSKPNDCELHSTFLSTADDLVHKSEVDQLEILLKGSLHLCHSQPYLPAKTRAVNHDWSWTHPVHSLPHKMLELAGRKKLLSKFSRK